MHKTSISSRNSSDIVSERGNSYVARLRRLKIQEGILSANVTKTYLELQGNYDRNSELNKDKDFKKYMKKLKDSYIEIKNLYEDIKIKTELTDIKDLKRDILLFEEKINSFKQFLKFELNSKQTEETTQMANKNLPEEECAIYNTPCIPRSKIQTKFFKEIVPSPVRVIINSPFKCVEIHQFQEFLKTSPNRNGGWNEFNHNLFIQIWNKYNGNEIFGSDAVEHSSIFKDFKNEVLHKISGIQSEDVILHCKWYSKYVNLKISQQRALDKWKENKKKIKNARRESKISQKQPVTSSDEVFSTKILTKNFKIFDKDLIRNVITKNNNESEYPAKIKSKFMMPTKQWLNRCESIKDMSRLKLNVENISKLRVPAWRLNTKSA